MNAITTPTCWCEKSATMTVPIDPEVTPWDGELRQSDGSPALAVCQEHARDGYELLAVEESPFQLGSWTPAQLTDVRATAMATDRDQDEALVLAIDAELEERISRGQLDREEVQLDRLSAEATLRDAATDVLAELILEHPQGGLSKARVEALARALPWELWSLLAAKLEVCPVHVCDFRICEDDEDDECQAEREGAAR